MTDCCGALDDGVAGDTDWVERWRCDVGIDVRGGDVFCFFLLLLESGDQGLLKS